MHTEITQCRICDSSNLFSIINLGEMKLTGLFPRNDELDKISSGPLELMLCKGCSLVQLKHSFNAEEMFCGDYGYRSGLNASMVSHLVSQGAALLRQCNIQEGDTVVDIGSNDGTLLNSYSKVLPLNRVGIDPTAKKFRQYYQDDITIIPDFFSAELCRGQFKSPAKIVTSIAMFYDLEDPKVFAEQIHDILDDEGIWYFEQSYLPAMLNQNSYDTICHEHIEYYTLTTIQTILKKVGFKIINVSLNEINGGSIAITTVKNSAYYPEDTVSIDWLLKKEELLGLHTEAPYEAFARRVVTHKEELNYLIERINEKNKTLVGLGASTKGNVLLQYCHLSTDQIRCIGEINQDKYGFMTPGTAIPIISEEELFKMSPDYIMILPWHFRNMILEKKKDYLDRGGKFILPLPHVEVYGR